MRRFVEPVLHFFPQRGPRQRFLDDLVQHRLLANAGHARPIRHVFEYRLRKRIRLLKHHADPLPQFHHVDLRAQNVRRRRAALALHARAVDQGRSSDSGTAGTCSFRNPTGPMNAVTQFCGMTQRHIGERLLRAVVEIQMRHRNLRRATGQISSVRAGRSRGNEGGRSAMLGRLTGVSCIIRML